MYVTQSSWRSASHIHRPGHQSTTDRIEGLPLGGRMLSQLVLAVTALGGADAVSKLHVVLHINEEQESEVMTDLWMHKFYG